LTAFHTLTARQGTSCVDTAVESRLHLMQLELSRAIYFSF